MSKTKTVTCPYCKRDQEVDIDEELHKKVSTVFRMLTPGPQQPESPPEFVTINCTNRRCGKQFKVSV